MGGKTSSEKGNDCQYSAPSKEIALAIKTLIKERNRDAYVLIEKHLGLKYYVPKMESITKSSLIQRRAKMTKEKESTLNFLTTINPVCTTFCADSISNQKTRRSSETNSDLSSIDSEAPILCFSEEGSYSGGISRRISGF